jgi:hypothetical protein
MRKLAGNYLSGKTRVKSPSDVSSGRYTYLSLDEAEPNLGTAPTEFYKQVESFATGRFQITGHGFADGEKVVYRFNAATPYANLVHGGTYFVSVHDANNFFLSSTKANALDNTHISIPLVGGQGNHYFGKDTVLSIGFLGERSLVDLGDDLELESIAGTSNYKLKISDGAVSTISAVTNAATSLEKVCEVGATSSFQVSFLNTTDASSTGTASVSVSGGLSVAETLLLDDSKSLKWYKDHGAAVYAGYTRDSEITSTYVDGVLSNQQSSMDFVVGTRDHTGNATTPTDAQATVLSLRENANTVGGGQTTQIRIGKCENNETNTDSSPSTTIIRTNQILELAPATVGQTANTGTVKILGNLEVLGTQTTVDSTTLEIADLNIIVAKNAYNSGGTSGAGFQFGNYDDPANFDGTGGQWVPAGISGITANLVPKITWESSTSRITSNKSFEAPGFVSTSGSTGFLISDGSVDTSNYATTDTEYVLDADTSTRNAQNEPQNDAYIKITDDAAQPLTQKVHIIGAGGIAVESTAKVAPQVGPPAVAGQDAQIVIDGSGLAGTTYQLQCIDNANNADWANVRLNPLSGSGASSDLVVKGGSNISVTQDASSSILISNDSIASYSDLTISNLNTTSGTPTGLVDSETAINASSATSGIVAKFARTTQGEFNNGGVIHVELDDDNTASNNPWMTFANEGTAVVSTDRPVQGSIVTKHSEYGDNKSGIRIWGQDNIDFDVSNDATAPGDLLSRKLSITSTGLTLRNTSTIKYETDTPSASTFATTLDFVAPTVNRTITFPDATGEVAIIGNFDAGGPITTVNGTTNADHYIVFAQTAVSGAGTTQDPLTNTSLKFNPSTGTLTATSKSFLIDHPTKDGMKLQYTCLEGPENGVYVRGRLKDDNVIELPDYWVGLVDEDTITVNLTPIGCSQDLYVQDIVNNQVIVNDNENINCFYTIFAERKDIDKLVVEYEDV